MLPAAQLLATAFLSVGSRGFEKIYIYIYMYIYIYFRLLVRAFSGCCMGFTWVWRLGVGGEALGVCRLGVLGTRGPWFSIQGFRYFKALRT